MESRTEQQEGQEQGSNPVAQHFDDQPGSAHFPLHDRSGQIEISVSKNTNHRKWKAAMKARPIHAKLLSTATLRVSAAWSAASLNATEQEMIASTRAPASKTPSK